MTLHLLLDYEYDGLRQSSKVPGDQLKELNYIVADFSGTYIVSNEFAVIGRPASIDNLGVFLGLRAKCGHCGHRWQKVDQKTKI